MSDALRSRAEGFLRIDADETPTVDTADLQALVRELLTERDSLTGLNEAPQPGQRASEFGGKSALTEIEYRHLAENTVDILYITNTDGVLQYVGPQVRRYGFEPEDIQGNHFLSIVVPEDREQLRSDFRKAINEEELSPSEFRVQGADGTVYWFEERGTQQRDSSGRIVGLMGALRDVTERKRAEQALRESEEKHRTLFERSRDAIMILEPPYWKFASANAACVQMFRCSTEADFLSYAPWELSPEYQPDGAASADKARAMIDKAMNEGSHFFEWTHKRADGEEFPATVLLNRFTFNGESHIQATVRDVTERKKVEEEARMALERLEAFESAVNQGPAIVFRWNVLPGAWPVELVSSNVRQLGYEADDLVAGRISWPGITHPDDVPRLEEELDTFFKQDINEFHQHYRLITKSGQVRQMEDWNNVIRDSDGNPTHIQAVVLDVTDHRREQQQRQESEERYRRLFEAESDAIMVFDAETRRVVDVNQAAMSLYGYTKSEFLELTHLDITAEPAASDESIRRTLEGEDFDRIPLRWHRKKDGTVFPVEISPSKFTMAGREVLCGIVRDITDRKKAEHAMYRQRDRLRELAARLANAQDEEQRRIADGLHDDVAQLLTAANLKLSLARGCEDQAQMESFNNEVERLLKEASEKVRVLSFDLTSSTLYRLGLPAAVEELCECMEQRHGVRFNVIRESAVAGVDEDVATVLFKGVRELLFNVVKHAGVEEAFVRFSQNSGSIELTVEDQGSGFPHRVEDDDIKEADGLGLFGVRERLRDLGGTMFIDSEPHAGTRVTLRAPAAGRR